MADVAHTPRTIGQIVDETLEPSPMQKLRKRIFGNYSFLAGLLIILIIFAIALLAPLLAPHDPYETNLANRLTNPQLDPYGKIPEFKYCAAKIGDLRSVEAAE